MFFTQYMATVVTGYGAAWLVRLRDLLPLKAASIHLPIVWNKSIY
jgi:hypothetical protein